MTLLQLTVFLFLLGVSTNFLGCAKKLPSDTSFTQVKKGFERELTPDQRKATIKKLQTETSGGH